MKRAGRKTGPYQAQRFDDFDVPVKRSAFREYAPVAFGGLMLVTAFAFAGHYMGQNAVAHNAVPGDELETRLAPASNLLAKGSLVPDGSGLEILNLTTAAGKIDAPAGAAEASAAKQPLNVTTIARIPDDVQVVPASVDLKNTGESAPKAVSLTPPKAKIEQAYKMKRSEVKTASAAADAPTRSEKQKAATARRLKAAEENCLARAVYFEARSESELGQLAVAKVILNRVKSPEYPNTICGVVYQGSGRRNSCQFSFACDGQPDDVKSAAAWARSKAVAQKALNGSAKVAAIGTATNYHADYVKPRWAKSMKRLIKIGRHVFYQDS